MDFVNEKTPDGNWQTIDKDQGIILTKLEGGRSEYPYRFRLEIRGRQPVEFETYQKREQPRIHQHDGSFIITWKEINVFADLDEFLTQAITESLKKYGFCGLDSPESKDIVKVEFMPR